jgi:hypothetical protein
MGSGDLGWEEEVCGPCVRMSSLSPYLERVTFGGTSMAHCAFGKFFRKRRMELWKGISEGYSVD